MKKKVMSFEINVFKLSLGFAVAQGIGILTMPLIARLYCPEAFGQLGLFVAITSITGTISCLRYEQAVMLPKNDGQAANLLAVAIFISLIFSIAISVILALSKTYLLHFFKVDSFGNLIYLIPLMTFISGVFFSLDRWVTRMKNFGTIAKTKILQRTVAQGGALGFGIVGFVGGIHLIFSQLAAMTISALFLFSAILRSDRGIFQNNLSPRLCCLEIARHKNFPKYGFFSALLNSFSNYMPVLLFSYFFSSRVVGFYTLGRQMLFLPMSLIGVPIGQVFFQQAAQAEHDGRLDFVVINGFEKLVSFGMFPFLILTLVGDDLFVKVFGTQWIESGRFVQIMSIWFFVDFISAPLSTVISIMQRQKIGLLINASLVVTRFSSIIIGGMLNDIYLSIFLISIAGILTYMVTVWCIFILAKADPNIIFATIFKNLLLSFPFLLSVYLVDSLMPIKSYLFFALITFISISYYIIWWIYPQTGAKTNGTEYDNPLSKKSDPLGE